MNRVRLRDEPYEKLQHALRSKVDDRGRSRRHPALVTPRSALRHRFLGRGDRRIAGPGVQPPPPRPPAAPFGCGPMIKGLPSMPKAP